jgi:lipopolysaccharide/colanic/teichoic acid biosynthesis glycosyltransferase
VKRIFDLAVSVVLLIFLWPILVILAIWIAVDSPGGAIYRQKRVGLGGKVFEVYKFRSMVSDADKIGGYSTTDGDNRITAPGSLIRKASLDELPQLWNVIKGDMSLVGPRPDTPMQEENYSAEEWAKRCSVRPGITGLAQATLRSSATPEERTRLDLEYVDGAGIGLDLKVLGLTVRQVLFRGGN